MHWKDRLLLTWVFASATLFNVDLFAYGLLKADEWRKRQALCLECNRRRLTLDDIGLVDK